MSYTRVSEGIYRDTRTGFLYERPTVSGKRTWRKLDAPNIKLAKEELASKRTDQARSRRGLASDPYFRARNIGDLIRLYMQNGCPDKLKRPRTGKRLEWETYHAERLLPFWSRHTTDNLTIQTLDDYADARRKEMRRGVDGGRMIDVELVVLSNAVKWAVRTSRLAVNPMPLERPKYQDKEKIRHCREVMPASGSELHRLARYLFDGRKHSETLGWWLLIEAMTGCRSNEVLRFRTDARTIYEPGFTDGQYLYLARSKKGVNPWTVIHPALGECLKAFFRWHGERYPDSPWWFPNLRKPNTEPADVGALGKAMARVSPIVCKAHRTPHGLRAFYVTVRRSQGAMDAQIAAEIGDKTAQLISTTYGEIPPNWKGGADLDFMPTGEPPAWTTIPHTSNLPGGDKS